MKKIAVILLLVCCLVVPSVAFAKPTTPQLVDTSVPDDIPPVTAAGNPFIGPKAMEAIVIHHSGSARRADLTIEQTTSGYRQWHTVAVHPGVYNDPSSWYSPEMPAQEGFPDGYSNGTGYNTNDLDYSFVIGDIPAGETGTTATSSTWQDYVVAGRRLSTVGWHSSNWVMNLISIGVCFMGNFDLLPPEDPQYQAGLGLVVSLMEQYKIRDLFPHSDFASKSCPGYAFPMVQLKADAYRMTGLYTDVSFGQWFRPYIATLGKRNLTTGYSDGSFRPNASITRAELVTLLWRASGQPQPAHEVFINDVPDTHWAHTAVSWAYLEEIADGYADGGFYPDKPITRSEMARVITLYLHLTPTLAGFPDVPVSHWASGSIGATAKVGIMQGDDTMLFHPDNPLTRAEACAVVSRLP
jgi:hypothetical protein